MGSNSTFRWGDFIIVEGTSDAPPLVHGFDLHPKNSDSSLGIEWRGVRTTKERTGPDDPILSSSGHIDKRRVFDSKGNPIGEDSRLIGWLDISYGTHGSVRDKDAALFDGVISSMCRLPSPTPVANRIVGD
jgi:hypothetical protein